VDPNAPVPPSYDPNAAPPAPGWNQAPGWQTPPPAQSGGFLGGLLKGAVGKIIGIVVVIAVLTGGYLVYDKVFNPNHRGEVVFSTTNQSTNENCKITNRTDTVKVGADLYVVVIWSHEMKADEKVVEEDFKDGVSQGTREWDPSDYAGYDCFTATDNVTSLFPTPGKYEIKLTVGKDVVADGTITVTP
jgi:hypothetical protein